jgi:hypothetical protein
LRAAGALNAGKVMLRADMAKRVLDDLTPTDSAEARTASVQDGTVVLSGGATAAAGRGGDGGG